MRNTPCNIPQTILNRAEAPPLLQRITLIDIEALGAGSVENGCRKFESRRSLIESGSAHSPRQKWLRAVSYDVADQVLKGQDAELNFPNAASSLPVPVSNSSRDIQAAATSAASALGAAAAAMGGVESTLATPKMAPSTENDPEIRGHMINDNEYVDDDMIFDMPNVLMNMAEGMLLSPPRLNIALDDHDACATECEL